MLERRGEPCLALSSCPSGQAKMSYSSSMLVSMVNRLSTERRARIIDCLVEGNSIRSTVRLTGAAKNTVTKLLLDLGIACSDYQDGALRNLTCQRVQVDEIWSFVGCKKANVRPEHNADYGDAWTFVAIDADTKLVPSWWVGQRTAEDAWAILSDLRGRLTSRMQLSTDGRQMYLSVTAETFGEDLDYAMVAKEFRSQPKPENTKYSPSPVKSVTIKKVSGSPDPAQISTSHVERQNLTIRMSMRRFTRLTNAFSKKLENLTAAVSLHFMYYNFARPHMTLTKAADGVRTTPAMAAGVADHVWTLTEIARLLDSN
jgi:IS1 family transposase